MARGGIMTRHWYRQREGGIVGQAETRERTRRKRDRRVRLRRDCYFFLSGSRRFTSSSCTAGKVGFSQGEREAEEVECKGSCNGPGRCAA